MYCSMVFFYIVLYHSKCTIKDQPLWTAFNGYNKFCAKSTGDGAVNINCRVVVRCPYTTPMLKTRWSKPYMGSMLKYYHTYILWQ